MKCATHTDREAIAICQSCGNALCTDCRITITGIAYCQSCLDAGRIRRPPQIAVESENHIPIPLGNVTSSSRRNLLIGLLGLIFSAIFIHALWMFVPIYGYGMISTSSNIPGTFAAVVIAVGICLSVFAWYELKYYFNFRWAFYIAIFTVLTPWWGVMADLLMYSGLVFVQTPPYGYLEPGPLTPTFNILVLTSNAFFGILMFLWAIALLHIRKQSGSPNLTLGTSIIYIILTHMMLLVTPIIVQGFLLSSYPIIMYGYYAMIPAILIEIGVVLNAIFFYRLAASLKPY